MIYWGSGLFWAAGTWRNSGPGPETKKHNFPELGTLFRPPINFLPEIAQLLCILCFGPRDPQGQEIAKYWFFRPFWPRVAPWHLKKFRAENRKTQFPGARGTFGGEICPPQKFLPESVQLFYRLRFGPRDPQGREIAKYWFFRPFWPRAALGT